MVPSLTLLIVLCETKGDLFVFLTHSVPLCFFNGTPSLQLRRIASLVCLQLRTKTAAQAGITAQVFLAVFAVSLGAPELHEPLRAACCEACPPHARPHLLPSKRSIYGKWMYLGDILINSTAGSCYWSGRLSQSCCSLSACLSPEGLSGGLLLYVSTYAVHERRTLPYAYVALLL